MAARFFVLTWKLSAGVAHLTLPRHVQVLSPAAIGYVYNDRFGGVIAASSVMLATAQRLVWVFGANETLLQATAVLHRLRLRSRRVLCGLSGHHMVRHFEANRLALRCVLCGIETPGWTIDVNPLLGLRAAPVRRPPISDAKA